jgi:hypothetical protein
MRKAAILALLILVITISYAQEVPQHISSAGIYEFLDELAGQQVITLNTVVKPYSRMLIAEKLQEATLSKVQLNKRQLYQLDFYIRAYRLETGKNSKSKQDIDIYRKDNLSLSLLPPGVYYKDSLFTVSLQPILGYSTWSNSNGSIYHSWGGLDFKAYIGKHWGIYSNLRDNHESELMASPSYFTQLPGGNYKINEGGRIGGDYSEMRGGIIYSWNWGSFGLLKDHFEWGNNYNGSNIFSGRTPSFAQMSLHLSPAKWFDFHYVHGWLVSEVIDSARTYNYGYGTRNIYREKYIAANIFTFTPFKRLNISVGNSIIYSDLNVQAAYLVPFLFYKSVDHTINHNIENQNSQLFFDVSSRQIKHIHLFTSVFVDEFSISRVGDKNKNNFIGWKFGSHLSNLLNKNIAITVEYTQTSPITYQHKIPAVTFESNKYNLGHYLRANSRELFVSLGFKPYKQISMLASFTMAEHGNDYSYTDGVLAVTYPLMKDKTWQNQSINFKTDYEFAQNNHIFVAYTISDIKGYKADEKPAADYLTKYTEPFFQGKTNTLNFGLYIGL